MYFRCHRVDFALVEDDADDVGRAKDLRNEIDTLLTRVCSVHRLDPGWCNYRDFRVSVNLYHGTRKVAPVARWTSSRNVETSFYERLIFDEWFNQEAVVICTLPRESRLVFTLTGVVVSNNEVPGSDQHGHAPVEVSQPVELAWAALQMFDEEGRLAQGQYLLTMWPMDADTLLGPAPSFYAVPSGKRPKKQLGFCLHFV
jgi:hypothetical protein